MTTERFSRIKNVGILKIILRIMRLMSVRQSLSGKNWPRNKNGKGTMGCGPGMGLSWELVERKEEGETKKIFFLLSGERVGVEDDAG